MDKKEDKPESGLVSTDGFFQTLRSLNTNNLEYACKSLTELHAMLIQKIKLEQYEQCACIRDEINKRETKKIRH